MCLCTWSLIVITHHPGVSGVTLCRDVLSTSWNGDGSIRVCSILIGLSSSASSQALICFVQSKTDRWTQSTAGCRVSNYWLGWFRLSHCWPSESKVQYLLWGHGVSQWRGCGLLKEYGSKIKDGWIVSLNSHADDEKMPPGGSVARLTSSFTFVSCHACH